MSVKFRTLEEALKASTNPYFKEATYGVISDPSGGWAVLLIVINAKDNQRCMVSNEVYVTRIQ